MKKIACIFLSLLCVVSLFSSCGRDKVDISGAKTISDLSGATIGAQTNTFHYTALDQIDGVNKKQYPSFTDLLIALTSGAIDGYVAEEPTAFAECLKDDTLGYIPFINNDTGFAATPDQVGIAIGFQTGSSMVAQVNAVLAGIDEATQKTLMNQIVTLSGNKDEIVEGGFALSSTKTDTSSGVLKIGMECAYDPFNWTQNNDKNGAVAISGKSGFYANGYDVQVAKYIAAELGMKLEIYQYDWDGLIPAVQSGALDAIIAGMSPTAEREMELDFTNCYYTSNLVVLYKK